MRLGLTLLSISLVAFGCGHTPSTDSGTNAGQEPAGPVAADGGSAARPGAIALENARPGVSAWQLERPAREHQVEGYASVVSARAGDQVRLYVNVDHTQPVHYELYRMGYYQGLGGRFISSAPEQMISPQPACEAAANTGLVECAWDTAFEVTIAPDWVTGQYFFKLITADGFASYVPLVVREPKPRAQLLVQSAVTTWQAYNVYGGSSLYRNMLPKELGFTNKHANAVSFDRPYTCQDLQAASCRPGAGDFDMGERWFIYWLEQRDVDVAYVTNLDVDSEGDPELLRDRSLFIAVGHDEYWPLGERSALEQARAAGVSLAFLSANTGYWRIRLEASSGGVPRRTVTCYKNATSDVHPNARDTTTEYRLEPYPSPEQALIGIMYDDAISRTYFDGFAQVVTQNDHWVYEGTGVRNGDYLSHVTGYEFDRAFNSPEAPGGREIVAHANLFNVHGAPVSSDISVYYPTEHSLVFAAGSIYWARGLSVPRYADPRIERMTENVLRRAGIRSFEPTSVIDAEPDPAPSRVEVVAGSGASGTSDGPVASAQFIAPVGIAVAPDGTLYVTDVAAHAVRQISTGGEVTTLAGCGHRGNADGRGRAACFANPTGIALTPDGTLYVADTGGHTLRAVKPDGTVSTLAGSSKGGTVDSADPRAARFSDPRGLALAQDGSLYIADSGQLRKLDGNGVSTPVALNQPTGVAVAADGGVYVIATRSGIIQRWTSAGLTTLAGIDGRFGDADGSSDQALLRPADGIAVDGDSVIFTDTANHKLRMWSADSGVSTLAGGNGNVAELQLPRGVAVTSDSYFVADTGNHRIVRVRKP